MLNESDRSDVCSLCGDTGWVANGLDGRVARCRCFIEARGSRLVLAARIPARYANCEFGSFETEGNSSLEVAKIAAQALVAHYPVDMTGMIFVGPTSGVGKTHLMVAIIRELMRSKGTPCLFYDYRDLLKEIQHSYKDSVQTTELEVLRPVFETEVLALDELGTIRPSEWIEDTVSFILNARYNNKRTTILTTNFPDLPARGQLPRNTDARTPEAAKHAVATYTLGDRIGERMRSRLHEMCRFVNLDAPDYRQKFRTANFR